MKCVVCTYEDPTDADTCPNCGNDLINPEECFVPLNKGVKMDALMETELELNVRVVGTAIPFQKGRQYLSNGDPGYPDEGGYCEDIAVYLTKQNKVKQKDGSVKIEEVSLDITDFIPIIDELATELHEHHTEQQGSYECAMKEE